MPSSELRIAMLAAHSCPVGELGAKDTGGMSVYIREVARELSEQGHSVDVYTRVHDPADPIVEELGTRARLIHVRAGQEAKINKLEVYSYLPEFTRNLENFRLDNNLSYDLVFSHYWLSGLVGQSLQKLWRVPHVIMFHTLGAVKNDIGVGEEDPILRIDAEKELIDSCQCIIAATDKGKEELEHFYGAAPGKISVVPCGVNMELFQPVTQSVARQKLGLNDEKILVFVGRLDPLKGIERLLEAVPRLGDSPGLKLIIIGGDESSSGEVEKLRQLSSSLGIRNKIDFLGTVKQTELPYYYSAADICVVPSYYESFGLVALEALSCGTPVVSADVGDLKNIILPGKTGYVVKGNNPEILAGGIARTLKWPTRSAETALAIRASVGRFSWGDVASEIASELGKVLDKWLVPVT
ncbi:MAG: glycosyltransferase [Dehalococcoidales bacterium]